MQFGNPSLFWLLALVPLLVLFLTWAFRARRKALERFAAPPLGENLAASVSRTARRWKAVLLVGAVFFAVIAMTGPRWGWEWRQVKRRGVDVFVLLDVSKSMLAEDVRPNRLTQAKFAVEDLLNKLEGDRIGLIAFAGTAFVQCPLTVDYEAFRLTVRDADPRIIPRGGTAIGPAVRTALKGFEAGEGRDRAIVLITDGEETAGDALAAADQAGKTGVHIYAIGVGTAEGELIPAREEGKPMDFLKDREGKVVKSRLDEDLLKQLALRTQGIYVRSAAGDFGIDTIYDKGIAQLQRDEYEARLQKRYFERFQWPLGVAFALLVIEMFLSERRRTSNHRDTEVAKKRIKEKRATAAAALCVLCLCGWMSPANADESWPMRYNEGVRAYRSNDFASAATAFEQATASPGRHLQAKAFYNLGNSCFRLGQAQEQAGPQAALPFYRRAQQSYEVSLALSPEDEDAKINKALAEKKVKDLEKQLKKQQVPKPDQGMKEDENGDQKMFKRSPDGPQSVESPQGNPMPASTDSQQRPEEKQAQQQPKPDRSQQQAQQQEQQQAQPQQAASDNLDKQQATALLDNLHEDERNWNFFPEVQMKDLKDTGEPAKDW
jgi:Ca-activated chloride channel homolog